MEPGSNGYRNKAGEGFVGRSPRLHMAKLLSFDSAGKYKKYMLPCLHASSIDQVVCERFGRKEQPASCVAFKYVMRASCV